LVVKPDLSVDTGSGSVDSQANGSVLIPSLTAHNSLSETWAAGIAVNAPFGLETEWPAGTFDSQYPGGGYIPTRSKLEVVAVSPSFAYKAGDRVSLAGGVDLYWMRQVIFNSDVNAGSPGSNPSVNLNGDGRGAGLNLGLMVQQGNWTFGGSYHTEAKIPVEGTIESPTGSAKVNSQLTLPARLQLGIRHQTTDKLGIEFDFTRTGWRSFDQLIVDEDQYGTTLLTSTNNWDDANAYRFGITYDITEKTQLRTGYSFDETPQEDTFFSPRVPDADRQLFSLGIGHTLSNGWTIDASYMYVSFDDRTVNIDAGFSHTAPYAGETNGTSAVNGTYESCVHLFGLGISKKFM
jgi:long-chain fatty acid transport protein